ncbi:MAG: hypothetical protein KKC46_09035 [Proteobacteria bacterium]|nr:hypothetical protein [Pseudomonadota bacterium]
MTKKILRGVQNLKTLSGSADEKAIPYKAYMKLSILEMEKFRRGKERESAQERMRHIDQRFGDIEEERQKIIATLESNGSRRLVMPGTEKSAKAVSRKTTGPFKIKY